MFKIAVNTITSTYKLTSKCTKKGIVIHVCYFSSWTVGRVCGISFPPGVTLSFFFSVLCRDEKGIRELNDDRMGYAKKLCRFIFKDILGIKFMSTELIHIWPKAWVLVIKLIYIVYCQKFFNDLNNVLSLLAFDYIRHSWHQRNLSR